MEWKKVSEQKPIVDQKVIVRVIISSQNEHDHIHYGNSELTDHCRNIPGVMFLLDPYNGLGPSFAQYNSRLFANDKWEYDMIPFEWAIK